MKTRSFLLLLAGILGLLAMPAWALITFHGREHLGCSGWSEGLAAIINHPARISGQIGPLGPTARFHYSGDAAIFNELLQQYAALGGQSRVLYLEPQAPPAVEGFKNQETHDFDLSVNQSGEGFLHLYTLGRIRLEDLKIPAAVRIEALPSPVDPADPKESAKLKAEQKRVADFVAAHKTP
jgi:hypothetical protein